MLKGETIATGAPVACEDCGVTVELAVCRSAAGYYLGTTCSCGPYTRESEYFSTREAAKTALEDPKLHERR